MRYGTVKSKSEDYCILRRNAVRSGINLPVFQRNLLLPSLRQRNAIMKKA
jgi:hypothetical protein